MSIRLLIGDCREVLRTLPDESVHCVVTSPPYFGLRDYGTAKWEGGDGACGHVGSPMRTNNKPSDQSATFHGGSSRGTEPMRVCHCGARRIDSQIGLEPTPDAYVAEMVGVFREVRRVLRKDGTCWVNLGDAYAGTNGSTRGGSDFSKWKGGQTFKDYDKANKRPTGLKPKDLIGIPWRVAFALQADGWWLRQDIIWAKPNPMPESVTDRCCKSHEYIFLLSKSARYYFDQAAIAKEIADADNPPKMGSEIQQVTKGQRGAAAVLLFGEGTGHQEGLSTILPSHGGAKGTLSNSDAASRKGGALQGSTEAIRPKSEGPSDEGCAGQTIFPNGEWSFQQAQNRDQTQTSDQVGGLHADSAGVERDQDGVFTSLRVLPSTEETFGDGSRNPAIEGRETYDGEHRSSMPGMQRQEGQPAAKRIKRSVWTVPSAPFSEAHFATFPPALIEPCIKAGCPEKACGKCGAPWVREVERTIVWPDKRGGKGENADRADGGMACNAERLSKTIGFSPSCSCNAGTAPGVCLDPFGGAGTTGLVADRLGRDCILIELNPAYAEMGKNRIVDDGPLFAQLEMAL